MHPIQDTRHRHILKFRVCFTSNKNKRIAPHKCLQIAPFSPDSITFDKQVFAGPYAFNRQRLSTRFVIEDNRVVPRSRRKFHAVQQNGVRVRSKSMVYVVREAKITMLIGGDAVDASGN
jgi:hypothetical protein